MRRRFLLRAALFLVLFVTALVAAAALVGWIVFRALGVGELGSGAAPLAIAAVFAAMLLVSLAAAGRGMRRVGAPISELIDALGRVAAGDHGVRVPARGSREGRAIAGAFNAMAERLEGSETQRRTLLADVTHELRTPLTVIQAQVEGLLDGVYPSDEAHLGSVLDQARILSRLIDDLRTLSIAEAGALELHREETDVMALLAASVASFQPEAEMAGVSVSLRAVPDMPHAAIDPVRVRQVLNDLLGNSLKHTPRGGSIAVSAELDRAGDRVRIAVVDTGSGIEGNLLPHVFDRFYRSRESAGSGLGLAIAKGLVTAHGGEIAAESGGAGRGTTIHFTLPLAERFVGAGASTFGWTTAATRDTDRGA